MLSKYIERIQAWLQGPLRKWIPENRRKVWLGLGALYVGLFLLFAYLLFPYDYLKDYILQEIHHPRTADGNRTRGTLEVELESLRPHWFTGVKLHGVRITQRPPFGSDKGMSFSADELVVKPSLFTLLGSSTAVGFAAEIGDGKIKGEYQAEEERTHIEADMSDVDLSQLGLLKNLIGLTAAGTVDGEIDLTVAEDSKQTEGKIDVQINKLKIGDGKSKLKTERMPTGMAIEPIDAGNLEAKMEIREGVGQIQRFRADGKDIELAADGQIRPRLPLAQTNLDILLRFKFSEEYKNRSDMNIGLFMLLDNDPMMARARTKDGWLQYRIRGNLARIRPIPEGSPGGMRP